MLGVLNERLIDTSVVCSGHSGLRHTPAGAFGSCRFKWAPQFKNRLYQRLLEVFKAHNIGYFFYNAAVIPDMTNQLAHIVKKRFH